MDEETKIIADLCGSVGTMKVNIEILKNGATNSGANPAGLQNSDVVLTNPSPNKRRKAAS